MFTFTWNDAYENAPTENLSRSSIDDEIRRIKVGVRERMEKEHEWGHSSQKNDGSHRPGHTRIMQNGSVIERDGILNPQTGALFLLNELDDSEIYYFDGTNWINIGTTFVHDNLTGLHNPACHPQYMLPSVNDESYKLNMGGHKLTVDNIVSDNLTLWDHANAGSHIHSPVDTYDITKFYVGNHNLKTTVVSGRLEDSVTTGWGDSTVNINHRITLSDDPYLLNYIRVWTKNATGNGGSAGNRRVFVNDNSSWGLRVAYWLKANSMFPGLGVGGITGVLDWSFLRIIS